MTRARSHQSKSNVYLGGGGKKVVRGDAAGRLGRFCKINAVIYRRGFNVYIKDAK